MKKSLMGTTALVAAAVAVSGARADEADEMMADEMMAEPISVSIGGVSRWGIAIVDSDSSTDDDLVISNDVELGFAGSTVLDSGLEVGMRIEIEGEESDDQGDRTYAFVSGSFGEFRIGNDSDMSEKMSTVAPYATFFYALNSPFWAGGISGSISTYAGADFGKGVSLLYFSPVINGFQFGVSYTPESEVEARSGNAANPEGNDVVSIGARYAGAFGDTGIAITVGYASKDVPTGAPTAAVAMVPSMFNFMHIDAELDSDSKTAIQTAIDGFVPTFNAQGDPTNADENPLNDDGSVNFEIVDSAAPPIVSNTVVYVPAVAAVPAGPGTPSMTINDMGVGVSVSMSGVSIGGSYRVTDDESPDDKTQYDFGIMYGDGPWSVSLNWGHGEDADDQDAMTAGVQPMDIDLARLLANYNVGPGINLIGAIGNDSPANGQDTTFAGVALTISF